MSNKMHRVGDAPLSNNGRRFFGAVAKRVAASVAPTIREKGWKATVHKVHDGRLYEVDVFDNGSGVQWQCKSIDRIVGEGRLP